MTETETRKEARRIAESQWLEEKLKLLWITYSEKSKLPKTDRLKVFREILHWFTK